MVCFIHSYYSLRYGTLSPEKCVAIAAEKGWRTIALTDINNTTAIPDFVNYCRKAGLKPIAGVEIRNENKWLYTLIAKNHKGLSEINSFISYHNINRLSFPEKPSLFESVCIIFAPGNYQQNLTLSEFSAIPVSLLPAMAFQYKKVLNPIAYPMFTFSNESDIEVHRNLKAIDLNILFSRLTPNYCANESETFQSESAIREKYQLHEALYRNNEKLALHSEIQIDFDRVKNRSTYTGHPYDDKLLLEKLAFEGASVRYGKPSKKILERIRYELELINKLGFSSYFLITWDIIRYSMSQGFYHVGRGSGANSLIAFCLKITDVDPIELDLYFERFINPNRTSPPDFDIDYSWKDRDQVFDYIFKRYGHQHTALLGAMSTFRGKSIYRELGKVHGLPKNEIDSLVENPEKEYQRDSITANIQRIASKILDFPNLRSIHAGGVLISEEPIFYYTALDLPPKGFQTTQWDMYVAEMLRFEKFDILSQRGIGHIGEAAQIIRQNQGQKVDVHAIEQFKNDEKIKQNLRLANTTGCFYIESPAMRGLLTKLRCSDYLTLVAASSIIRPGVAKSGMMREYIFRYHNPDKFQYIHPVMKEQLGETYGVMVYQEDVLKICHHFAGLDLADADVLRRAMSGKTRSREELDRIVKKFFDNCRQRSYPDEISKEVWRQIESFAGYSFSKAHSASYAVESFQSLFLKTYFPLEFMTAVINNFGGFYHTWVYFNEAKRMGAVIELPCVNQSNYKTSIQGKTIYIGFVHIEGLQSELAQQIEQERLLRGHFTSLENFIERCPAEKEQIRLLIKAGAFRFTRKLKTELYWKASLLSFHKSHTTSENALFQFAVRDYSLPKLENHWLEDAYDELELLGFPVSCSFFDMLKTNFRGDVDADNMIQLVGKTVKMLGRLVTIKYVKTTKGNWMNFGTFIDPKGNFFDTVHYDQSLQQYPFRGSGIYLMQGKITQEFGYASLTVEKMAKMPLQEDPRSNT